MDQALEGIDEREPTADPSDMYASAAVVQRRRSVAHFLSLIDDAPRVVEDEGAYREALWSCVVVPIRIAHERVAGQWAGLIAKDVWQDALCSIWSEFCKAGLRGDECWRGRADVGSGSWHRVEPDAWRSCAGRRGTNGSPAGSASPQAT